VILKSLKTGGIFEGRVIFGLKVFLKKMVQSPHLYNPLSQPNTVISLAATVFKQVVIILSPD
jgi:hypothetical protein